MSVPIRSEYYGFQVLADRLLNRSAWTETHQARDAEGKDVALTLFDPDLLRSDADWAQWHALDRQLRSLGEAQEQLPNVAPLIESGECDGQPYIAQRYVRDIDLAERMRSASGGLHPVLAVMRFQDIVVGLAAVQTLGISHGGLRPESVWLHDQDAMTYVTDFGVLPMLRNLPEFQTRIMVGREFLPAARYLAPEFFNPTEPLDARSDVYSLGVLLYEVLTGEPFHNVSTMEGLRECHDQQRAGGLAIKHPAINSNLAAVLQQAIAYDPRHRYGRPAEFLRALRDEGGLPPETFLYAQQRRLAELIYADEHSPEVRAELIDLLDSAQQGRQRVEQAGQQGQRDRTSENKRQEALRLLEELGNKTREEVSRLNAQSLSVTTDRKTNASRAGGLMIVWGILRNLRTSANLDGTAAVQLQACPGRVYALAFQPQGNYLALAGDDQRLRFCQLVRHPQLEGPGKSAVYSLRSDNSLCISDGARLVTSMAFSPDGTKLATSSHDGTVRLWDVATRRQIGEPLRGHRNSIYRVRFNARGDRIVSGSQDGTARVWSVENGDLLAVLEPQTDWVYGVAFSPKDDGVVTAGADGAIKLWEFNARGEAQAVEFERQPADTALRPSAAEPKQPGILDVVFSPDSKLLAAGNQRGEVLVWEFGSRKLKQLNLVRDQAFGPAVRRVAFSPDGSLLAGGRANDSVSIWRVEGGSLARTFHPHKGSVQDLVFSSTEACLLGTVGDDGYLRLWT